MIRLSHKTPGPAVLGTMCSNIWQRSVRDGPDKDEVSGCKHVQALRMVDTHSSVKRRPPDSALLRCKVAASDVRVAKPPLSGIPVNIEISLCEFWCKPLTCRLALLFDGFLASKCCKRLPLFVKH